MKLQFVGSFVLKVSRPCVVRGEDTSLYKHHLGAEVVMLFAVERLSERSEDWPTNGIY